MKNKLKRIFSGVIVLMMIMLVGSVAFASELEGFGELITDANGEVLYGPYDAPEGGGRYVWDPETESWVFIPEDEVPLEGVEPEDPPKTGDDSHMFLYGVTGAAALIGIGALEYTKNKKKDAE